MQVEQDVISPLNRLAKSAIQPIAQTRRDPWQGRDVDTLDEPLVWRLRILTTLADAVFVHFWWVVEATKAAAARSCVYTS